MFLTIRLSTQQSVGLPPGVFSVGGYLRGGVVSRGLSPVTEQTKTSKNIAIANMSRFSTQVSFETDVKNVIKKIKKTLKNVKNATKIKKTFVNVE